MAEQVFFDEELHPNPPMGPKGMTIVIGFVAFISFCAGIMFVLRGAWPVTPFFGADVLLLVWAFRASVRASKRRERLFLTADRFIIEHVAANGIVRREEINPYWLRVDHDDPELIGLDLALIHRGRRWIVGSFLGAEDRTRLAEDLRRALRLARTTLPVIS
jgi:uncharacterized membrane protein